MKPAYQQPIDAATYAATLAFFEKLTLLLHPFMPFITEEIWQALTDRKSGASVMVEQMPTADYKNGDLLRDFELVKELIAGVRSVRLERNIPNKDALTLRIASGEHNDAYNSVIAKLCNLEAIERGDKDATSASFMVRTTEYAVPLGNMINADEEIAKMETEIGYLQGFLKSVMVKLSNERFVANAKPEVVENERKKQADAESKIQTLQESIQQLKG